MDELRKVLGEVLGEEEFDADEQEGEDYDDKNRYAYRRGRALLATKKNGRKKITARKFSNRGEKGKNQIRITNRAY